VLDKKWGAPTITKDGVTVAKEVELKDPYENMGAQMVKEWRPRPPTWRGRHHHCDRAGPAILREGCGM